jgi:hypothetical protein
VAAKLAVWVRPGRILPGLLVSLWTLALQLEFFPDGRWEQLVGVAMVAAGGALWSRGGGWGRALGGGGVWVVLHATVGQPPGVWTWADLWLVLLLLGARWIRDVAAGGEARDHDLFLVSTSAIVAGWILMTWSLIRLEWLFVTYWIPPEHIEQVVFWVMPLIALRFPLGFAYFRWHLAESRSGPEPQREQLLLIGGRGLLGIFFLSGIGLVNTFERAYQHGIEATVIWGLLTLGALLPIPSPPRMP